MGFFVQFNLLFYVYHKVFSSKLEIFMHFYYLFFIELHSFISYLDHT